MDRNILSPYVRLATYSVIEPGVTICDRVIYDYEIIFVKDGRCRICIEGKDYICTKNNVVFLRPGILHSFHNSDTAFVQPHIHFDAVYWDKSKITPISFKKIEEMSSEERELIQKDVFDAKIPYVFYPKDSVRFQEIFFKAIDNFSKNENLQLYQKAAMLELLECIIGQFETGEEKSENSVLVDANAVREYIDGNFRQVLSLDMLAEFFCVNKFTMLRRFKREYGINIMEYYHSKRISDAQNMLEKTGLSVRAIGDILNFTDAYSFSRFFKEKTGYAPKKYREKLEN